MAIASRPARLFDERWPACLGPRSQSPSQIREHQRCRVPDARIPAGTTGQVRRGLQQSRQTSILFSRDTQRCFPYTVRQDTSDPAARPSRCAAVRGASFLNPVLSCAVLHSASVLIPESQSPHPFRHPPSPRAQFVRYVSSPGVGKAGADGSGPGLLCRTLK